MVLMGGRPGCAVSEQDCEVGRNRFNRRSEDSVVGGWGSKGGEKPVARLCQFRYLGSDVGANLLLHSLLLVGSYNFFDGGCNGPNSGPSCVLNPVRPSAVRSRSYPFYCS